MTSVAAIVLKTVTWHWLEQKFGIGFFKRFFFLNYARMCVEWERKEYGEKGSPHDIG